MRLKSADTEVQVTSIHELPRIADFSDTALSLHASRNSALPRSLSLAGFDSHEARALQFKGQDLGGQRAVLRKSSEASTRDGEGRTTGARRRRAKAHEGAGDTTGTRGVPPGARDENRATGPDQEVARSAEPWSGTVRRFGRTPRFPPVLTG